MFLFFIRLGIKRVNRSDEILFRLSFTSKLRKLIIVNFRKAAVVLGYKMYPIKARFVSNKVESVAISINIKKV